MFVVAGWHPLIKQIGSESTACQQSASHAESRQKYSTRTTELTRNQQLHAHVLGMGIGASARVCSGFSLSDLISDLVPLKITTGSTAQEFEGWGTSLAWFAEYIGCLEGAYNP